VEHHAVNSDRPRHHLGGGHDSPRTGW
jgi:hypothetical protein